MYQLANSFISALLALLSEKYDAAVEYLHLHEMSGQESRPYISFYRALALYHLGDNKSSLKHLQAYLTWEPTDKIAYLYMGNICFYEQNYEAALTAYSHALEIQKDFPEALINAGILSRFLGDEETAKKLAVNEAIFHGIFEDGALREFLPIHKCTPSLPASFSISDVSISVTSYTDLAPLKKLATYLRYAGLTQESPLVSVIMPVYNAHAYLAEAIESILNQTYVNWELVAIDDGSTDDSRAILQEYARRDQRIRVFQHPNNRGVSAAKNTGIDLAKGKYLALMDADDISLPERLAKQVAFMEQNPQVDVCGTFAETFDIETIAQIKKPVSDREIKLNMLIVCAFVSASAMLRLNAWNTYKLRFDESLHYSEDYDLWCRAMPWLTYHNISDTLYRYRNVQASLVHKNQKQLSMVTHSIIARNLNNLSTIYLAFPALHKPNCTDEELTATINDLNQVISHLKQPCFFSPGELQVVIDYLIKQCQDVLSRRQEKRQIRT